MKQLTITLTDFQHEKLEKLAAAKERSIEECIRAFAESCVPGGSGWQSPGDAAAAFHARKRLEEEAAAKVEDAVKDVVPSSVQ